MGVYMLLDTTGTYAPELKKAQSMLNYLLLTLQPQDTLAAARIDTRSFAQKDIMAKVTFNQRPSIANNQKRAFQKKISSFLSKVKNSRYTDITGGILQAMELLNQADPAEKYILIFSDLKEELEKEPLRDVPFQLAGYHIIALNVTKLNPQSDDLKQYLKRIERWRTKVESGNGKWSIANDMKQLENIIKK
ncbi:MAG: VWA domain-containing protein [Deltaproteobacteria bacterium]|nr:VWA domain-containing protein [Deltaproteobacteria bacterium]NNK86593.1 VWA domain-containing protein [Desulfobacterales bacterium]